MNVGVRGSRGMLALLDAPEALLRQQNGRGGRRQAVPGPSRDVSKATTMSTAMFFR